MDDSVQKFNFPYTPYPQQTELMECIYNCLQEGKIGLLESPTGTGKSLSTICSSFSWLLNTEKRIIDELKSTSTDSDINWLETFLALGAEAKDTHLSLKQYKEVQDKIQLSSRPRRAVTATSMNTSSSSASNDEFTAFMLNAYDSDCEDELQQMPKQQDNLWNSLKLPQILYCSRTHSQLTQFVGEVKKAGYHNIRLVVLGSRKSLCINPLVKNLPDPQINEKCLELQAKTSAVANHSGEKRKRKKESGSSEKCPYRNNNEEINLSFQILSEVRDIEEIADLGKSLASNPCCPFYSVRKSLPYAQVICMPYNVLLSKDIRESNSLFLHSNQVVIIDEAHNLVEAVNQLYSCECSDTELTLAVKAVKIYLTKFQVYLNPKNLFYINMFIMVLKKLKVLPVETHNSIPSQAKMDSCEDNENLKNRRTNLENIHTVNNFLFRASLEHVNLFKLKKYLQTSNLLNRIGGYTDQARIKELKEMPPEGVKLNFFATDNSQSSTNLLYTHALRTVTNFLSSLTHVEEDGRVVCSSVYPVYPDENQRPSLKFKYILLNPHNVFRPIVDTVRSVVLLGGTMKPISYFLSTLFYRLPIDKRVHSFSCSHVASLENTKTIIIPSLQQADPGKQAVDFEFTHTKKYSVELTSALFTILFQLAKVIPHGLVIFFTSYQYLDLIISRWKSDGKFILLDGFKRCFVESKNKTGNSNETSVWHQYSDEILKHKRGAILFAVVNGSLSEGINFSDDLARGVVVVGMPYPDSRDIILQEKIKCFQKSLLNHLENKENSNFLDQNEKVPSHVSLVSLQDIICMRAVNQAIGRSIRHINDYACTILIDSRFQRKQIQQQLPDWVRGSLDLVAGRSLPSALHAIRSFFCK
jgi:chromosome transmission fidelity protein 1